jgi:uncharacterized protein YkwD
MRKNLLFTAIVAVVLIITGCGLAPSEEDDLLPRSQVRPLENDLFTLVNQARSAEGVSALVHDEALRTVAYEFSEDMYRREFFSHTDPDGHDVTDRLDDAGISYTAAGENIAWNSGASNPVQSAHNSLMASPGHRANIVSTAFTRIGCGIASDGEKYYFTQVFTNGARLYYHSTEIVIEPTEPENPWQKAFDTFDKVWQSWQD